MKNYYPIGTYQIVYYDKHDEVIKKKPFDGPLYEAQAKAKKAVKKNKCASAKVLRVVFDTKYNAWAPKHG